LLRAWAGIDYQKVRKRINAVIKNSAALLQVRYSHAKRSETWQQEKRSSGLRAHGKLWVSRIRTHFCRCVHKTSNGWCMIERIGE